MRLACIMIPLFPLAARLRSEPELVPEAVALVEGNGTAAHVAMATRRARKAGVRPGMTLAQARAILPKLIARGRDAECERAAQEVVFETAEQFSPRVEDAGEGVVYLDISGMEIHFRGEDPERQLAGEIVRRLNDVKLASRVGVAGSKLAARVAAELPRTPNVIREGEEKAFLAPLPLTRLAPAVAITEMLSKWGLRSIGEFARLPESEIASRLGEAGRALHYAARGIDPEPLLPKQPPPDFREGMDLEWPIVTLEPFLFVANAALDRLMQRMAARGYACTRLEVSLRLEPDGFHDRAVLLPAPTRDVRTLLTLVKLDLEAAPPGAAISGFTFIAHPDQPRHGQLSLFGPAAMSHDKLTTTIARIASLIGGDRIGSAAMVDGHLPERFELRAFDPPPPPRVRKPPRRSRGLLAIRVLRPPVPLEVVTDETRQGDDPAGRRGGSAGSGPSSGETIAESRACFITRPEADVMHLQLKSVRFLPMPESDRAIVASKPAATGARGALSKINSTVRVASGPWTLEEGWWNDTPVDRDYWDVELSAGGVFRIYRDRTSGAWFADGMYD